MDRTAGERIVPNAGPDARRYFLTIVDAIASAAFSIYVSNFANYDKTYGSLGAVIILLLWLYISFYARR